MEWYDSYLLLGYTVAVWLSCAGFMRWDNNSTFTSFSVYNKTSTSVTISSIPAPPTLTSVTAVPINRAISVTFTPPSHATDVYLITSYYVIAISGSNRFIQKGTTSHISVIVTPGLSYTIQVGVVNVNVGYECVNACACECGIFSCHGSLSLDVVVLLL